MSSQRVAKVAEEAAYYFNGKIPALALIGRGVRFPGGKWIRVGDATAEGQQVQDMVRDVFPSLKGKAIISASLRSESDVQEFEARLHQPG